MKKILILSIAALSVFACSSSHEDEFFISKEAPRVEEPVTLTITEMEEALYGLWKLNFSFESQINNTTSCTLKNTLFFKEDGTFYENSYTMKAEGCENNLTANNTWKYLGNNKLALKFGNRKSLKFRLLSFKTSVGFDYTLEGIFTDGKSLDEAISYNKL